jgi:hypothetical protein
MAMLGTDLSLSLSRQTEAKVSHKRSERRNRRITWTDHTPELIGERTGSVLLPNGMVVRVLRARRIGRVGIEYGSATPENSGRRSVGQVDLKLKLWRS